MAEKGEEHKCSGCNMFKQVYKKEIKSFLGAGRCISGWRSTGKGCRKTTCTIAGNIFNTTKPM